MRTNVRASRKYRGKAITVKRTGDYSQESSRYGTGRASAARICMALIGCKINSYNIFCLDPYLAVIRRTEKKMIIIILQPLSYFFSRRGVIC